MASCRGVERWCRILVGAVIVLSGLARAEVVPDLYSVSVPVADQSPAELQRAAASGLRELSVRISGRSSAAGESALAAASANAMRFIEQYRYERGESALLAQMRFSSALVDAELRKAGQPVWGANRPSLVTAVIVEEKGVRTLVDAQSPLAAVLREQWRRRGLVLHLPNADALKIDEVMQLDVAKMSTAPRGDGVMLGVITVGTGGGCDSRWRFSLAAQQLDAQASGGTIGVCIATALDRVVDNLSAQYVVAANGGSEGLLLRVTGIVSFDDYAALSNYLRRLSVVKNAQPILIAADEVFFQLKIAADADQLARQLALESRLSPQENRADARMPVALSYRWAAQH